MVIFSFDFTLYSHFIALCKRCRTFGIASGLVSMNSSRHISCRWMNLLPSALKTLRPD